MAGRFSVEAVFKAVDRVTAPISRMQNRVGKFTRGMQRGFHKLNKSINRLARGIKNTAATAAKFAVIGIGAITASVGLLVREFSKIEDAEAAFTPLLGGAKKAKELIAELNETAASTPFQFETLSKATSQLLPVMNGDIKNTIKTIRMLGDTAGGNAQKLDSITRGFTKAMLKGKVDMESLNMIAEAGVPIFTELADSMGVKVNAAFFKMISAGKVATKDLTKAFEKMTNEGGVFFRGMEIASKTTTGLWSTMMDNISLTAAELGSILAPVIKDLIGQVTGVAKSTKEWVKNNRELISAKFLDFVESGKRALSGLVTVYNFLSEHGATILKTTAWIIGLSLVVKALVGVLMLVNLVMAANPITLFVLGIIAAIAVVAAFITWIDEIAAGFENLPGIIRLILAPLEAFVKLIKFIKDSGEFLGGKIGKFLFEAMGASEDEKQPTGPNGPQIVSPQERAARSIEEQRTTSTAEVTIKDDTGRAEVTGGKLGAGLQLQKSGAM